MFVVVFFSFMAMLLTYLESKAVLKHGMKFGFILVTILGAIHYDYGNDYMSYLDIYKDVTSYSFNLQGILAGDFYHEPGWALLCWLFKPIGGFFMMVAVLNVVQNTFIYNFIKNNVEHMWWPLSVFIYLFATSYFLMSFSMMRQIFVMTVFLGMWPLINGRKWWVVLLVFYLCSFVHSSSLFLFPFAFWGFLTVKKGKIIVLCYVVVLLMLWLFQNILNDIFQYVAAMDDTFSDYADTYGKGDNKGLSLGLGFAVNMITFLLSMLFILSNEKSSVQAKQLVALGAIIYLVTPFSQIIPLVGRLGMYFGIYSLGAIPLIYGNIKRINVRKILLSIYIIFILYDYFKFFQSEVWGEKYSYFHTIFSQL